MLLNRVSQICDVNVPYATQLVHDYKFCRWPGWLRDYNALEGTPPTGALERFFGSLNEAPLARLEGELSNSPGARCPPKRRLSGKSTVRADCVEAAKRRTSQAHTAPCSLPSA